MSTACGKKKPAVAPENTTDIQNTTPGAGDTGGTSYGGASYGAPTP
jgi:hypothetical protein